MALTTAEVSRIKFELGYNVLTVGAEPYIGVTQLFDQILAPYTQAGASTTSSTAVTASSSPAAVTLTLASATGFAVGNRVVVDVDDAQESATVRSLSGATIVLLLAKAHAGTYPVTVEGGETIIRGILQQIQRISGIGSTTGKLQAAASSVGVKRVNEIEFFGSEGGGMTGRFEQTADALAYWRDELASALGVENLRGGGGSHRGGGSEVSVY